MRLQVEVDRDAEAVSGAPHGEIDRGVLGWRHVDIAPVREHDV